MLQETVPVVALPPVGVLAGEALINFETHRVRANPAGARHDFELMMVQLVRAVLPGVAVRSVDANPGDWGIDVFIGDLSGSTSIWQSKYFIDGVGESQKQEIRDSFASVVKNSAEQGFTVERWVLCIPRSMDGPTTKWWDGWKRRKARETDIVIELWDETELRGLLSTPDADSVRRAFYGPRSARSEAAVVDLDDGDAAMLETALFVRQLRAAGQVEVAASKYQFFNAELMAREIVDKGVPTEVAALAAADAVVHGVWEEHFNEACEAHEGPRLPGLHPTVMREVRAQHPALSRNLPAGLVHTCGLMHRVVDNRRAGWVRDWRQVAVEDVHAERALVSGAASAAPDAPAEARTA
ncbi:serine/threonine protein kinase [Parafrankia sp. FMc6]|uniref:serine/threonine protein kinase n=1 Tax=Parafrankia soli TaxID=2599596 RepID=UPI0034D61CA6